jgi:hypothetical protein
MPEILGRSGLLSSGICAIIPGVSTFPLRIDAALRRTTVDRGSATILLGQARTCFRRNYVWSTKKQVLDDTDQSA